MSKQNQNTPGRRNTIKFLAASGAVITGRALPESWTRPVLDSVVLPAHAQMSPQDETPETTQFSDTQTVENTTGSNAVLNFSFDVAGLTPFGDGTVRVTAIGDIAPVSTEFYTIALEGTPLGTVGSDVDADQCSATGVTETLTISEADLVAAAGDGTVELTATAGPDTSLCPRLGGGDADINEVTITLEFTATT